MSARRKHPTLLALAAILALGWAGCTSGPARRGQTERGVASWYGPGFHGRTTANGETYDMDTLTAAHKTLPFGTRVEVRNLDNGLRIEVRVNDRGPFVRGRIIDLSRAAARSIDMLGPGTARVELRVLSYGDSPSYVVQLGAFRHRANAEALLVDLAHLNSSARLSSAGGWHRVLVGPMTSKREAKEIARQLRRGGYEAVVKTAA